MQTTRTLALLFVLILLVACGAPPAPAADPTAAPAADPTAAPAAEAPADRELVLAAPRDLTPGEQDPYFAHPMLRVWEALVQTDENWSPQPGLAEAWELSADGLTWTFNLRRDVVFSDGTPFNADVVIANVERFQRISPRTSPFYSLDAAIAYGDLNTVTKVDDYTVQFVHNSPELFFPDMLANYYSAMFAPASFDAEGNFADFPIGSGPFMVTERVAGEYFVLTANPNYHGDPPASQTIRVRTIPDANTRASALRAGEIHGVIDLGALPPAIASELVQSGGFGESSVPNAISHYLYTQVDTAPWDDVRLRRAVSLAIDRELLANVIWQGYAVPAGSMLTVVSAAWHDPTIEASHDLAAAQELAREVLGDERVPALLVVSSGQIDRGYPYKPMAEYIQAQLAQLGIDVEIQILEGGAYRETTESGNYDLALSTHGVANSEPAHIFRRIAACDGLTNQRMSLGYCNPELEQMLAEIATTRDTDRRAELSRQLQELAAADLPVIPLLYDKGVVVFSNDVSGLEVQTTAWATLQNARLR